MNKSELIDEVANKVGFPKANVSATLDAILEAIESGLKDGNTVQLVGFGSFTVGDRAAREGRNPKTGEPIPIAAAKVPKFSAGKKLKEAVNGTASSGK